MKILYVTSHPLLNPKAPSGYGVHIRNTVEALEGKDLQVRSLFAGEVTEVLDVAENLGGGWRQMLKNVVPQPIWEGMKDRKMRKSHDEFCAQVKNEIESFRPDVVYERNYSHLDGVSLLAEEYHIPHVVEVNAPFIEEKVEMNGASVMDRKNYIREHEVYKKAALILPVSERLGEWLAFEFGLSTDKIQSVPNAVDYDLFNRAPPASSEKWGLDPDKLIVGFIGSIFPYHGVNKLIDSFARIRESRDDIQLIIAGDGELLASLKEDVRSRNLEQDVIFTGQVPQKEVPSLIKLFDVAVMPKSNWYGSPIKLFEYAAASRAIVAPDTAPVREVFRDGENASITDQSHLTETIASLLNNPDLRLELGANASEMVATRHTWSHNAQRIKNLIESL